MEFRDVLAVIWKRRILVAAAMVACVALSALFVASQSKRYESTATLALTPNTTSQTIIAPDALGALLGTYAETAKSRVLTRRAEATLKRKINGTIQTDTVAGTGILRIIARSATPEAAAQDANAVAAAFIASIGARATNTSSLVAATVVDPALPNDAPVQPRPKLSIAVGALLGLFAGIVVAFVVEQLRRRITTPEELQASTVAPLVGRIPRSRALSRGKAAIVWNDPRHIQLHESYRALRTNMNFVLPTKTGLLQFTSPELGAGKSTVCANLAIAFGQIGVKTILVDADLRRPRVHELFGLDNHYGLSHHMSADSEEELRLLPSGYENVTVLPSGPPPVDPTEMLSLRIGPVLSQLRALDALVLIDSAPLLPVSDARLIAPHTSGVVMVVESGAERPARLQLALERLRMTGAPLLGVVLNKAKSDGTGGVGAYGYAQDKKRTAGTAA